MLFLYGNKGKSKKRGGKTDRGMSGKGQILGQILAEDAVDSLVYRNYTCMV